MAGLGSTSTSFTVPQHPLPEEIRKMERDETVCKFCGVSYLIHNEMKALQGRLAEAEKQMEYYKGSVEREKVLKEKLEKADVKLLEQSQSLKDQSQQLELFKSDLKMKVELINNMYSQKRQNESDLQDAKFKSEKLNTQIAQLAAILPKLNCLVREQKETLYTLRKEANKQQLLNRNNIDCTRQDLEKVIKKIVEKTQNERESLEMKWKGVNEQLLKSQNDLRKFQTSGNILNNLQIKCGELEKKVTTYQKLVDYLEEENKTWKEKTSIAENDLHVKRSETKRVMNELETLRKENEQEVLKHKGNITKKDDEIKKLSDLCKSLEKLMNEKSAAEMTVRKSATSKDAQLKILEQSLFKAKEHSEMLKLEREQTIHAHHHRIEQLRESYVKKFGVSEKSYEELQKELNEQRKKLENDFEGSTRQLREEFNKERDAINTTHSENLNTIQEEVSCLNEKLEKETCVSRNLKDEINQLKNKLSTNKANTVKEIQKYQNEALDLKAKLDDLQHRPNIPDQDIAIITRKYQTAQKSLQDSNIQLRQLQQELMSKKEEMIILQDTVCRECEERLELTQALSDARMKLLTSQSSGKPRNPPFTKANPRLLNRECGDNVPVSKSTSNSEVSSAVVDLGYERKVKSSGGDNPRATRESVDCFRERIAVALGRQSRTR